MIMPNSSVSELEHCRSVLLRVVKSLSNEQLDFQVFPDAKPIGELLLHVAGFEFLMVSGAKLLAEGAPDHRLWLKLKPGFAREAGFPPPQGRSLDDYLAALTDVRQRTLPFFAESAERRMVQKAKFPITALVALLRDSDPEANVEHYNKIAAGARTTFSDDGSENERGETDLVNLLQLHETYHRDHITLQKYLYTRLA